MEIISRNTNTLQSAVYRLFSDVGVERTSRNGPVLMIPEPVSIRLSRPWERVNFCPVRDANPFFHLWESLAMLNGTNSVHLMASFAKNMLGFSDDGRRYNAFYGERARVKWGDQISWVIKELSEKPDSRQCVITLWDVNDWLKSTKDKACNLQMLFSVDHEGRLRMTTTNRSNDAIWGGVTGANVVHLSFFQEYVALALGLSIGPWWHFSNNLHVYTENPQWAKLKDLPSHDTYPEHEGELVPLLQDRARFDAELADLVDTAIGCARTGFSFAIDGREYSEPFLRDVAVPVFNSWVFHKHKQPQRATDAAYAILAGDWRVACVNWLNRRYNK